MAKQIKPYNYLIAYNQIVNGNESISSTEVQENSNSINEDSKNDLIFESELPSQEKLLIKQESFDRLSNEAKEIILMVINASEDFISMFKTKEKDMLSPRLFKESIEKSWKSKFLVEQVFKEIKEWIKQNL